mmetsp:Transcript_94047/g.181420  ORF Transcript_94047/g.181420 Transcript_94047/m.181420 type:complete len:207 (-) Transcript_94047:130-750(-)
MFLLHESHLGHRRHHRHQRRLDQRRLNKQHLHPQQLSLQRPDLHCLHLQSLFHSSCVTLVLQTGLQAGRQARSNGVASTKTGAVRLSHLRQRPHARNWTAVSALTTGGQRGQRQRKNIAASTKARVAPEIYSCCSAVCCEWALCGLQGGCNHLQRSNQDPPPQGSTNSGNRRQCPLEVVSPLARAGITGLLHRITYIAVSPPTHIK